VIGEATVPHRRTFPPGMNLIAMIGFVFGALAAAAWVMAADRLPPDASDALAVRSETRQPAMSPPSKPPFANQARQQASVALIEKPLIARLQESDVVRTLSGILKASGARDLTRLGWPTLRAGFPMTTFLNAMREMRATLTRREPASAIPVMAMIGAGAAKDRSIAALNIALAAARDGARLLMIDADHVTHALSNKINRLGQSEASRLGWLGIGSKASRAIKTINGISILPDLTGTDARASDAIHKAIAQARATGGYDLIILDGPPMPLRAADRGLLDAVDGIVAILPVNLDINDCMEDIIASIGGAERKLIGVVLNELSPASVDRKPDRQYA
jgi:Mrp family chromosome partitioning ATPase